jgi:hypothetical protein
MEKTLVGHTLQIADKSDEDINMLLGKYYHCW